MMEERRILVASFTLPQVDNERKATAYLEQGLLKSMPLRKVERDKYLIPHLSAIPYMVKTILPELQLCGPG